ncbi:hypothetical protein R5R35_008965 [Gryllus longicercus]|uniref:Uncharacterized protein n=1 Tax=Gryllus longicercus TaxID=2509291 RepID=A0AAN9VM30_9ORTH
MTGSAGFGPCTPSPPPACSTGIGTTERAGNKSRGRVRNDPGWRGTNRRGAARHGDPWCGGAWCGVAWNGVQWSGEEWSDVAGSEAEDEWSLRNACSAICQGRI